MCATCGCCDNESPTIVNMQTGKSIPVNSTASGSDQHLHSHEHSHGDQHSHSHQHSHGHEHSHGDREQHSHSHEHSHGDQHSHSHQHSHSDLDRNSELGKHAHRQSHQLDSNLVQSKSQRQTITLEEQVLAKNDEIARQNRQQFKTDNVLALNLVASPGAGKTALLERTIADLKDKFDLSVIEGDQATINDAERIKKAGVKVIQINTGANCHLNAEMVAIGLEQLAPLPGSIVFIENVGNLVCPALFDLGEELKVVILSVTEGEDKPLKYPHMFRAANVMVLNKIDLLPYLKFDVEVCKNNAMSINPNLEIIELSTTSGDGLESWYAMISKLMETKT